jgi:molybdopterin molybdotransferase
MISLEEAQSRLIALARPLPIETVPLLDARGRWIAAALHADRTQPARDMSAMDGYAVAHADGTGPWTLVGESAAGKAFAGTLGAGQAVRIFTGAVMPAGADCVVIQEDVLSNGDRISLGTDMAVTLGQHVRKAGSDFTQRDLLIGEGEQVTAARIALAAMGGYGHLPVRRRATVALISTGDELVEPGAPTRDDQIPSSNALMLAAMLGKDQCVIVNKGIVPDTMDALRETLRSAEADIIVTIGGASVGDHDLVRPALLAEGANIDFWKVAMRPGKPLMAGTLGSSLVLGLPGNPVSAFATAMLFLKPLVAALGGASEPLPRRECTILDGHLAPTGPRVDHVRALRSGGRVSPVGQNDSAALLALARSDAFIIRPPNSPAGKAGDQVEIYIVS